MYVLENQVFADINGESILFGYRVTDKDGKLKILTLKEIDKLRKEFKIKDTGLRHLLYIRALKIEENKVIGTIPQRYLEQLEYMGYDISKLNYTLKK